MGLRVREGRGHEQLVAQAEIQREPRGDLPVVLNKGSPVRNNLLFAVRPAPATIPVPTQQAVSEGIARRPPAGGTEWHFGRVLSRVLEPASAEARWRAGYLCPAVLGAELDRVAALDQREVVGNLEVVHLVHVRPEGARADGLEAAHERQRVAVVQPVVDGIAGSAQDAERRVELFGERDVKASREECIAEAQLVEHCRTDRCIESGSPVLPGQVDRLAVAAVGGQGQAAVLQHELIPDRIPRKPAIVVVDVVVEAHVVLVVVDRVCR